MSRVTENILRLCMVLPLFCILVGGCDTYTKPATEVALLLTDFPAGWQLINSEQTNNSCDRTFSNSQSIIKCSVHVYSSTNAAKKQFDDYYTDYSKRFPVEDLAIGNQGYAFQSISILASTTMYSVFFRKNNVTVELDESSEMYGVTLDEATSWARIVEKKIT